MSLLGPEGATDSACERMRAEHEWAQGTHLAGLAFFMISMMDIGFLAFDIADAIAMLLQVLAAVVGICMALSLSCLQQ